MADRTVAVRLLAKVDSYKRDIAGAANVTKKFGADSAAATKSVSQELATVKTQSTIVGTALLGMAAAAVVASARFDKQMSGVAAVTNATAGEMDALRTAAIKAGQATVYSASEAAQAEAELAKAGIKTSDILGGALTGSLSLAAAGQLDLATAATISAQAMNTFGLEGKDVAHIADVLAAGANKSAADVGQLGDALRQGGLVANQTGLSLEDTVGVLSAFADRALIGSDAGTSLKSMLQRLTPQSQQAADMMDELGIHAYDAGGNFVGLAAFAQNLKVSLGRLTPEARASALSILFGSDAVRGATVLYDLGADGIQSYTNAVNDSGAASRMAATQMDNLAGDLEQLKGSLETTLIQSGSEANGVLRELVQLGTGVVNFVGDLPGPLLATGLAVTAMSGGFLIAAPRIVAVNEALALSPGLAKAASVAMKALPAAAGIAAIAGLALDIHSSTEEADALRKSVEELFGTLDQGFNLQAFDDLTQKITEARDAAADPGVIKKAQAAIMSIVHDPWAFGADQTAAYNREMQNLLPTFDDVAQNTERLGTITAGVGNAAGALGISYKDALDIASQGNIDMSGTAAEVTARVVAYSKAASSGSVASHKAADALDVLGDSTASVEDQLKALKDQWDATVGGMLGVSDATIAAEKALDDVTASLKTNKNEWRLTTEAGRANQSAVNDAIGSFETMREKLIETGQATEEQANKKMVGYLSTLRDSLPKGATAARAQIQSIIDKYKELPATKTTKVVADTSQAVAAVKSLKYLIDRTFGGVRFSITATGEVNAHGSGQHRATGGYVVGGGSTTSDSVMVAASRGEWITDAANTARNLPVLQAISSGARIAPSSSGGSDSFTVTAPLQIVQDSTVTWQGLLRLKRDRGGISLGIS